MQSSTGESTEPAQEQLRYPDSGSPRVREVQLIVHRGGAVTLQSLSCFLVEMMPQSRSAAAVTASTYFDSGPLSPDLIQDLAVLRHEDLHTSISHADPGEFQAADKPLNHWSCIDRIAKCSSIIEL